MRKRNNRIQVWLNKEEEERLYTNAQKAGLSQENYLRTLINGYVPKELPPVDYHVMIRELHAIGVNLNQISAKANTTGHIDKSIFQYEANRLRRAILGIQEAVTLPERREADGNYSDMGCPGPP